MINEEGVVEGLVQEDRDRELDFPSCLCRSIDNIALTSLSTTNGYICTLCTADLTPHETTIHPRSPCHALYNILQIFVIILTPLPCSISHIKLGGLLTACSRSAPWLPDTRDFICESKSGILNGFVTTKSMPHPSAFAICSLLAA